MEIKDIEEYPRKMLIEGNPSELYALLNTAINGLIKSIAIYDSGDAMAKELIERRDIYMTLFNDLNNKIKSNDS